MRRAPPRRCEEKSFDATDHSTKVVVLLSSKRKGGLAVSRQPIPMRACRWLETRGHLLWPTMSGSETGKRTFDLVIPSHCKCRILYPFAAITVGELEEPHNQPSVQAAPASRSRGDGIKKETLCRWTQVKCVSRTEFPYPTMPTAARRRHCVERLWPSIWRSESCSPWTMHQSATAGRGIRKT